MCYRLYLFAPPLHKVRTKSEQPVVKEEGAAGAGDGSGAAGADVRKDAALEEEEAALEEEEAALQLWRKNRVAGTIPTLIYFSCI